MTQVYHHGVLLKYLINQTPSAPAVLGTNGVVIYGTAPNADKERFPENAHIDIYDLTENELYEKLNGGPKKDSAPLGTLWYSVQAIYDYKIKPKICLVRVNHEGEVKQAIANRIADISDIESDTGINPKIVIAPTFTDPTIVVNSVKGKSKSTDKELNLELSPVVTALDKYLPDVRAIAFIDGLNLPLKDHGKQKEYRDLLLSKSRIQLAEPYIKMKAIGSNKTEVDLEFPLSAKAAGLRAFVDYAFDFSEPISNKPLANVVGSKRLVKYQIGRVGTESDLLNSLQIATVVKKKGEFKYLGLDVLLDNQKEFFRLDHVRVRDILSEMVLYYLDNYVDAKFRKIFINSAINAVGKELESMARDGVIYGGKFELGENNLTDLQKGKVKFKLSISYMEFMEQITIEVEKSFEFLPTDLINQLAA